MINGRNVCSHTRFFYPCASNTKYICYVVIDINAKSKHYQRSHSFRNWICWMHWHVVVVFSVFHPFLLLKLSIETLPNRINKQKLHFLIFIIMFFSPFLIFISGKWNFSIAPPTQQWNCNQSPKWGENNTQKNALN